jgi:geranylgeranyl pyrophosphate synthase
LKLIAKTTAIEKAREKAQEYADKALQTLDGVPESIYKEGLRKLAETVVNRSY